MPPVIIISHVALAVAGLGIWIAFVALDVSVLAGIAVALIVPTAGLGMATLVAALPEPAASARPASPGSPLATRIAVTEPPARVPMPVTVIAVHGVLATATILLALLAAIGAA
jgi:manganese efflux pump family protein